MAKRRAVPLIASRSSNHGTRLVIVSQGVATCRNIDMLVTTSVRRVVRNLMYVRFSASDKGIARLCLDADGSHRVQTRIKRASVRDPIYETICLREL